MKEKGAEEKHYAPSVATAPVAMNGTERAQKKHGAPSLIMSKIHASSKEPPERAQKKYGAPLLT